MHNVGHVLRNLCLAGTTKDLEPLMTQKDFESCELGLHVIVNGPNAGVFFEDPIDRLTISVATPGLSSPESFQDFGCDSSHPEISCF